MARKDLLAVALELGGEVSEISAVELGKPRFIRSCDECGNHRVLLCSCGHFACTEHTVVVMPGVTVCLYCADEGGL